MKKIIIKSIVSTILLTAMVPKTLLAFDFRIISVPANDQRISIASITNVIRNDAGNELVDIDEQALLATQNNATTNSITAEQLTIGFPDTLTTSADILIANILLTPLINLQHRFHQLLKDKGTLVVSGLLEEQAGEIIAAYGVEFTHIATFTHDGWALLVFSS